ncbi:MAG: sensor domain-containing protein [Mizugakiibacter sp.]|uniref:sensor domain-containing protein n=1 Tax=Mizugakiibacter sp. TaxID=1972610 RepID=UPI0031CB0DFD|nr:sensor domain-containing protein [Xanthomonadaceae bacterium]
MTAAIPKTIEAYLEQLREALAGADAALIQDALYDAEEYLRSELAENPGRGEAELLAEVATSYGAPEEVADIYRDKEAQVQEALRPPPPPARRSLLARFFGVGADPRAWAALFYMILSLATGIFYFTWAVTGTSLSLGLSVLIFGLPFATLFIATVRALSLVEGRLIEAMFGVRMPRRPLYADRGKPLMARIKGMFVDPRTWSTLFYMVLMLPLGILYFTVAIVGVALSLELLVGPILYATTGFGVINLDDVSYGIPLWLEPLTLVLGVVLFCALLHLARGIGHVHGALAKQLLVKTAQY